VVVDDLLAEVERAGRTVLIASHEAPPARLVHRTVVMDGGRLSGEDP